jgi:hypothetical protein
VNILESPGTPVNKGSPGVFDGLYYGVHIHFYVQVDISVRFW